MVNLMLVILEALQSGEERPEPRPSLRDTKKWMYHVLLVVIHDV
jgi:hypothetical protein